MRRSTRPPNPWFKRTAIAIAIAILAAIFLGEVSRKNEQAEQQILSELSACLRNATKTVPSPLTSVDRSQLRKNCDADFQRYRRAFCSDGKACEEAEFVAATLQSVDSARSVEKAK